MVRCSKEARESYELTNFNKSLQSDGSIPPFANITCVGRLITIPQARVARTAGDYQAFDPWPRRAEDYDSHHLWSHYCVLCPANLDGSAALTAANAQSTEASLKGPAPAVGRC